MITSSLILADRLTAVRHKLAAWDVDGVLITGYANRRWLSGFTGSNCQLLVTASAALLATDSRYYEQAAQQAPHFTLFQHERTPQHTTDFLATSGAATIGLGAANMSLHDFAKLKEAAPNVVWHELAETVESLRVVKTAVEIAAIRRAAAITDLAMSQVTEIVQPGMTERQVAWELEKTMRDAGADGMAFDILVASGPNAALPHHHAGDRRIQLGDSLIVDMGAMLHGYRSDMTRTFFVGNAPTAEFLQAYDLVLAAQTAVLDQARAGMGLKAVDAIARDIIRDGGHDDHFGHGLGHGVGLDIHEDPFLSPRADETAVLPAGATLTVEPGIYIPGWGGVRIEDLTVVTESGLERLSHCPKNPIIPVG